MKTGADPGPAGTGWKLEDAKARFSEVVRRAQEEGPQTVTVRGQRRAVVLAAEEYDRLVLPKPAVLLGDFLAGLGLNLDLRREGDAGRDVEL
jgi:prevent-host-death family protein